VLIGFVYPLLERLVYNLVVNYDVLSNIGDHLSPQVRRLPYALNWRISPLPRDAGLAPELTAPEQALRKIG
jgi:hypothetical protein